jgi:hypothetical protein
MKIEITETERQNYHFNTKFKGQEALNLTNFIIIIYKNVGLNVSDTG